ncbi:MAG: FlgD immunoglobulin-like domain containing protein [bacterium]
MRCNEARQRLSEWRLAKPGQVQDLQLERHLRQCPACARQADAIRLLRHDIGTSAVHDLEDGLPLAILKSRVEARVSQIHQPDTKEISLMTTIVRNLKKRPRLSAAVIFGIAMLVFLTLVPFKFDHTVGYEVAVAGVDPTLALDNDRVEALLAKLGMEKAEVKVVGCDTTCEIVISCLESQGDADLVVAAFTSGGKVAFDCEVIEVFKEESGSLLEQAKCAIVVRGQASRDDGTMRKILVEQLGEGCGGDAVAWMHCLTDSMLCGDGIGSGKIAIKLASDGQDEVFNMNIIGDDSIKKCIMIQGAGDGSLQDICARLKLEGGELDEELIRQLEEQGCEVTVETSADGTQKAVKIKCNDSALEGIEDEGDESAAKESTEPDMPDQFELSQNYPNPFNPTTTIGFSLPQSEHVTLEIVNIQGQIVRTLIDEVRSAGHHHIEWDATSDAGNKLASGVYFYRLKAGDNIDSKKMTLLK